MTPTAPLRSIHSHRTPAALHWHSLIPAWNRVDEAYDLLERWSVEKDLTEDTYVFFRPWMNNLRRDPRFVKLAKRLGLVDYWKQSGNWPVFHTTVASRQKSCRWDRLRRKQT